MAEQCKCGSLDFFMKKQGNNTGLYCSMCGKWQKWMNKDEIRVFEYNHKPKAKNNIKQTNADRIRAFSDEKLANFLEEFEACDVCKYLDNNRCTFENPCVHEFASAMIYDWLQSEVKGSDV